MSNPISGNLALSIHNIGEKFISAMTVLNDLLSKVLITVTWDNVENNNLVLQVLLGLSVFIATILLGIDSNLNVGRIYRKKYVVMVYSIITLIYFSTKGSINLDTLVLTIFLVLFLNSIAGINTAYNLSLLEKELDPLRFFTYSSYRWFFIAKSYISIILIIILFLLSEFDFLLLRTNNWGLEYLDEIIMFMMILFFFLFHIVMDVIDRFGYDNFDDFKIKLESKIGIHNKPISVTVKEYFEIDTTNHELLDMLGLILYVEDKDFMKRSKPTYSFYLVFRRKIRSINLKQIIRKKKDNLANNIRSKNMNLEKVEYIIKYIFIVFKKLFSKVIGLKNFIRGYSTLQQQIVRRTIMYPYSYNYLLRRKIFIENVYIKYFVKAYKIRIIKDKRVKRRWLNYLRSKGHIEDSKSEQRKLIDYEIKIKMLMYYYKVILGEPKDPEELLEKIYFESAHSREALLSKRNSYDNSKFREYIIDEIACEVRE